MLTDTYFMLVSNIHVGTVADGENYDLHIGDVIGHSDTNSTFAISDRTTTGEQRIKFKYYRGDFPVGFYNMIYGQAWPGFNLGDIGAYRKFLLQKANILRFEDYPASSTNYKWITKEFDLNSPGQRKKIYGFYVTFKSSELIRDPETGNLVSHGIEKSNVELRMHWIGPVGKGFGTSEMQDTNSTNYNITNGFTATPYTNENGQSDIPNDFITAFVKPKGGTYSDNEYYDVNPKNVYALKLEFRVIPGKSVPSGFEINDISVVYRTKSIKAKM